MRVHPVSSLKPRSTQIRCRSTTYPQLNAMHETIIRTNLQLQCVSASAQCARLQVDLDFRQAGDGETAIFRLERITLSAAGLSARPRPVLDSWSRAPAWIRCAADKQFMSVSRQALTCVLTNRHCTKSCKVCCLELMSTSMPTLATSWQAVRHQQYNSSFCRAKQQQNFPPHCKLSPVNSHQQLNTLHP